MAAREPLLVAGEAGHPVSILIIIKGSKVYCLGRFGYRRRKTMYELQ